jgi:starch synthase
MAKALSILFVASEAFPYAKESGVADVAASLPLAIRELGHDIRLMIPKYGCISERKNRIHDINRLKDIPVEIDSEVELLTTKSSALTNSKAKVQIYVTTNHKYFESRKGIYHEPVKWEEYPDNLQRFVFFSHAVIETCAMLGWYPDVIHCNDWQTALIPAYIKYYYPAKFKKTKTILTIHNAANQGEFPLSMFKYLGLPEEAKTYFTHKNKLNILKGGMIFANKVTTVSPAYLQQIAKDKEITNGLNTLIKQNLDRMDGISNGIDTTIWNPKVDDSIPQKFEGNFSAYKTANKMALCDACGLKYDKKAMIIGMVTRLIEPKGIDIVIEALAKMMKLDVKLVILGQGKAEMKEKLLQFQEKYSRKMSVTFAFNDSLAHLVEAGSDMFLMPSRQEACGLNLYYSLTYGSVPIVNITGGIKDSAHPFSEKVDEKTNCFALKELSAEGLLAALEEALELYKNDKESWEKLVKNGMEADYSWSNSAVEYAEIYKKLSKEE